ncbi:MAG: 16S rRNA processing protein RimM [Firmicutes bacterium]|nr:16S rRNA processing protein RimM [Bacillota bacterium]
MQDVRYVTVGKIANTQGRQGMLRILPLTDFPDRFFDMDEVLVLHRNKREILHIEEAFRNKRFIVIRFREIQDINEAAKYKGALLQVYREQAMDLPEQTYYVFEILGCKVYTREGELLGEVKDVIRTGANDVYVVEGEGRRKPLLVPALKTVVHHMDPEAGNIVVQLPEGLEL